MVADDITTPGAIVRDAPLDRLTPGRVGGGVDRRTGLPIAGIGSTIEAS